MKCTVCNHPQLHDIDQALLAGNATYEALSQQYGLSVSALFRHKKLLKVKMARVEADLENHLRQDTLFKYNDLLEQTRHLARTAEAEGNTRQALQAVSQGTRILNFITKLDVRLDQAMVYRVLASPQWAASDSLLPTDPGIITASHQALADDLFFPCQELPSALEDIIAEELASEDPLSTENRKLQTENRPRNQCEISAKLPKKTSRQEIINHKYQEYLAREKNTAKNPAIVPEGDAPPVVTWGQSLKLLTPPLPTPSRIPAQTSPLETRNSELETQVLETKLPPGITPEILRQILPRLDELPVDLSKTENRPLNQREISAKLPKKFRLFRNNNEPNQENTLNPKNIRNGGQEIAAPVAATFFQRLRRFFPCSPSPFP